MEPANEKQFKILVVDDNPKNIQVIGNILRESDYIVGYATGGSQALDLLQKSNDYDLVLLDVDMPAMNGYDTCLAIKNDGHLKEIPVIFLTAYSEQENIIKGFESGGQDYICKPFNSKELLARVDTHLQLKVKTDLIKKINSELEQKIEKRTRELQSAYDELHSIDKIKTDFLVFISQEIRTPLNGIAGTINLIKSLDQSSTVKDMLETLDSSVSKLEEFMYKALFFTQLYQNQYNIQISEISLKDLIQYSVLEVDDIIRKKRLKVSIDIPHNYLVRGDRDLLFKALLYILQNSIMYSPQEGKIEINLRESDGLVTCSILDYGKGFDHDVLDRLYEPYRFIETSFFQRTGLSLYIVKRIMELNNYEICFKNMENAGACVELMFKSI